MIGRFSPNPSPLAHPYLSTGEPVPLQVIMKAVVVEQYNRTFSALSTDFLPKEGIVRKIEKNSNGEFELLLEIAGITPERCSYIKKSIALSDALSEYEARLLPVTLVGEQFTQIPILNEVVDIEYKDKTDVTTIFRIAGKSKKTIDPNFEKCGTTTRTSSNFPNGA